MEHTISRKDLLEAAQAADELVQRLKTIQGVKSSFDEGFAFFASAFGGGKQNNTSMPHKENEKRAGE